MTHTKLATKYRQDILQKLLKELKLKNPLAVPKITKVIVSTGIGSRIIRTGEKDFEYIVNNITKITGQRPVVNLSKKAVSNFKLKKGVPVAASVTLRKEKMYDFLDRFINIVLPRVRDFHGLSTKSFDAEGNFSAGFKESIIFPEIGSDDLSKVHGIQVCIVTTASDKKTGEILLRNYGFPFKKPRETKKKTS